MDSSMDPQAALMMLKDRQISPMVIATYISCVSCGLVYALAATYFSRFPRDRWAYKLLVVYFVINNTLDTAFDCHWCYQIAVNGFLDQSHLGEWPWQLTSIAFLTGTVVLVCQLFFAWRTFQISGKKSYIVTSIQLLLILGGAACIYWIGAFATHQSSLQAFQEIGPVMDGWVAACLAADILITASLVYFIYYKPRKLYGDVIRSSPLMRLVILACETNLMSLLVQAILVALSVYSMRENSLHYLIMAFLEPKAYMACVIITLNARVQHGKPDLTLNTDTLNSKPVTLGSRFGLNKLSQSLQRQTHSGSNANSVHVHVERNAVVDDSAASCEYALQDPFPYRVQFSPMVGPDLKKGPTEGEGVQREGEH
ncbi:hypothetical protein JCM11641_000661 [Rhodosporidiobolus odoratus]